VPENTTSTFVDKVSMDFKGQRYWFILQELIQNNTITSKMKDGVYNCVNDGKDPKSIIDDVGKLGQFGTQSAFVWVGDS